jgi:heme-degrading monooxygenase HmoA
VTTVIAHAKGFKGYKVNRSQETPGRYVLMIYWATLEDHTVGFRQSDAFPAWRAIVGPFFAQPPVVEHMELVSKS